jgi:peptidoglycan/LPS O-acetylase OafA/YrhL
MMAVSDDVAMLGIAVFGGYILFWFALAVRTPRLARIGGRVDISYGVYLYAWPVQNLVIQRAGEISPWLVTGVATPVAAMLGYASWRLVEAPCLALGRRLLGAR